MDAATIGKNEPDRAPASGRGGDAVCFRDVRFSWAGPRAFSIAVKNFSLHPRERLLLLGPSGGGKSTFLSLLAGISVPQEGEVEVLGRGLSELTSGARDRFRAEHLGIIFQMFNLLPYGSVLDNVLLPLSFAPERRARAGSEAEAIRAEAVRLLTALGLEADQIEEPRASRLSVGQQQRVAAARALIGRPEIIVADEPTSSLDRNRQAQFLDLLAEELAAAGASLIMVSHDESLASRFDRVVRLEDVAVTNRDARQ